MQQRKIKLLKSFTGWKQDAVTFKTNAGIEAVRNLNLHAFEDVPGGDTAISSFYERILLGDQFPGTLIIGDASCVTAPMMAALFVAPDLVLEDQCSPLINSFSQTVKYREPGFAHVPRDHQAVITKCWKPDEKGEKEIMQCTKIIESYLRHGRISPVEFPDSAVLHKKRPFIAFECDQKGAKTLRYQQGFTCGLYYLPNDSRTQYFKKSPLVRELSLETAQSLLRKEGESWELKSPVRLQSPAKGTELDKQTLVEIGIRSLVTEVT